jgi:hypothetical protein
MLRISPDGGPGRQLAVPAVLETLVRVRVDAGRAVRRPRAAAAIDGGTGVAPGRSADLRTCRLRAGLCGIDNNIAILHCVLRRTSALR